MKRVLVYFPSNARAVDQQSVIELMRDLGHEVFLLTWMPQGDLHANVRRHGARTFSVGSEQNRGLLAYVRHVRFLVRFIKDYDIDIVFAHLQSLGLIAAVANRICQFQLYYVRHNTDAHILDGNTNAKIVNFLATHASPRTVAVSKAVEKYLIEVEGVKRAKITQINYSFNFDQYMRTDYTGSSEAIRKEYSAELLLICIGRFVPLKRHLQMFETVRRLRGLGRDVKLMCLGDGELRPQLERFIAQSGLNGVVHLLGYRKNVLDYLEAADLLLHFSETESLGMVVLEAGLVKTPAMVCESVGVFDEFIRNGENGFLISKGDPIDAALQTLSRVEREVLSGMGAQLYVDVRREFDIANVREAYEKLLSG